MSRRFRGCRAHLTTWGRLPGRRGRAARPPTSSAVPQASWLQPATARRHWRVPPQSTQLQVSEGCDCAQASFRAVPSRLPVIGLSGGSARPMNSWLVIVAAANVRSGRAWPGRNHLPSRRPERRVWHPKFHPKYSGTAGDAAGPSKTRSLVRGTCLVLLRDPHYRLEGWGFESLPRSPPESADEVGDIGSSPSRTLTWTVGAPLRGFQSASEGPAFVYTLRCRRGRQGRAPRWRDDDVWSAHRTQGAPAALRSPPDRALRTPQDPNHSDASPARALHGLPVPAAGPHARPRAEPGRAPGGTASHIPPHPLAFGLSTRCRQE